MFTGVISQRLWPKVRLKSLQSYSRRNVILRTFSEGPASSSNLPVKQWELSVSPFTKITTSFGCNVSIKPLDPHVFPEADRAFISVHLNNTRKDLNMDTFLVRYEDTSHELLIIDEDLDSSASVDITAPIKCDLNIRTKGEGRVKIQQMESDLCRVHTERGHCILKSVKGRDVWVESAGGDVTGLQTLHGNVTIRTSGHSNIDVKKIQGSVMNLSTKHGHVSVKAIYSESTSVSTSSGSVRMGHVHGEALVQSDLGNVVIDSSSGDLKVFTAGNIDAYVGLDGSAELHTQRGTVSVRVPSNMETRVELCGKQVDVHSDVTCQEIERSLSPSDGKTTFTALLNGGMSGERCIKATAEEGLVHLRSQSWFETLRLEGQS